MRKLARVLVAIALVILVAPPAAGAQPPMPVIGDLSVGSPESDNIPDRLVAFRRGPEEAGYIERRNVAIEYRWAAGQYDRLPALGADLVRRHLAVIVAQNTVAAFAAKAATSTIPIIFYVGIDPVQAGLVASLSRPGGNIIGVSILAVELMAKRLELLRELLPALRIVAFLTNPSSQIVEPETRSLQPAARSLALELHILKASTPGEIDAAFETLAGIQVGALVVRSETLFTSERARIVALAARRSWPAIYVWRVFPTAGGLMSYGPDLADSYHQVGLYTAKLLKGAKPAELSVQQVVKVELVINLRTAKALGLTIPQSLLLRADQVNE